MTSDTNKIVRHPPKKNMREAIKLLEEEIDRWKKQAIGSQNFADNPPNDRVYVAYWRKNALTAKRKAERLSLVVEWMEQQV